MSGWEADKTRWAVHAHGIEAAYPQPHQIQRLSASAIPESANSLIVVFRDVISTPENWHLEASALV